MMSVQVMPPWHAHVPRSRPHWYEPPPVTEFSALAAPPLPVVPPLPQDGWPETTSFSALAAPVVPQYHHPPPQHHRPSPVQAPAQLLLSPPGPVIPSKNMCPLDREKMIHILNRFSEIIAGRFGVQRQVRLVIHGGSVMLLNQELHDLAAQTARFGVPAKQRTTTRDIDYIARSFALEWQQRYNIPNANEMLKMCICDVASEFGLGADWMNSDPDVALPWSTDPRTGGPTDPIYQAALNFEDSLTVYLSPNKLLKLVSVTPIWSIALKLVRFNAADREDVCILLRSGTLSVARHHWTTHKLEMFLLGSCYAMDYYHYDPHRVQELRRRMEEVVQEANKWDPETPPSSSLNVRVDPQVPLYRVYQPNPPTPPFIPPTPEMYDTDREQRRARRKEKKARKLAAITNQIRTKPSIYAEPSSAPPPKQSKRERVKSWLSFTRQSPPHSESDDEYDSQSEPDSDTDDDNAERRAKWRDHKAYAGSIPAGFVMHAVTEAQMDIADFMSAGMVSFGRDSVTDVPDGATAVAPAPEPWARHSFMAERVRQGTPHPGSWT
ncbi:unnamed protein product [Mycena citricolor]|uniref:Uncharacterized protein n=1 Tax=Mycena citricolor TaxID=2018698 RepID=A0AAD2GV60_9AGAR|nr:unnamed protein product [Mycena citricolor]